MASFFALSQSAFSQNIDLRRKISVSGIAEQEVTPDIINVSISLQEYMDGRTKVSIEQLENQLEAAVKDAGIPKEDLTINDVYAFKNNYKRKRAVEFMASKQFIVRLHNLDKLNQLINQVDQKGITATDIISYDYSKITEVKRNLKIQALLAAKEKATSLLSSIDEKLGAVIEITEADNNNLNYNQPAFANTVVGYYNKSSSMADSDIDFKKIKLHFQINAVFEIAK